MSAIRFRAMLKFEGALLGIVVQSLLLSACGDGGSTGAKDASIGGASHGWRWPDNG